MFKTKNDLSESTRSHVVELCNNRLADAIDLMLHAKQAHWNVKGPQFIALHELFDKIYEDAAEYVDLIAERVVQLGGSADGTRQLIANRSTMPEYPANIANGRDHVEALSNSLAFFGKAVRFAINKADELEDKDTADIFTEVSRGVDKWLWFVEAHAQAEQ
ncbi:MAG: DNA starvation/stationary phase protection protein Dps [Gemmataceae bacterium]